ncbi:Sorbitol dehydrogenase [Phytophthora citrophthora]|uniref:Sorbitol dehydrogenase n=1 Tax=Phytophthora citrophthora TaxID=4793 RepID=A0AAD9GYP8_9STRA|nr:Sorbitol dehydrogenase [Phytophthora citrophthora]
MAMASPLGSGSSSSASRRGSSDSASSPSEPHLDKKRKLVTVGAQHSALQATRKRRSILNEEVDDDDVEDAVWAVRTPSKQMSIANLITSPPTPTTSDDSFWAATSALADVTIKPEKFEVDVEMVQAEVEPHKPPPSSSSNIPAAFLATQAFASPRDFFVAPMVAAISPSRKGDTGTGATTNEKAHVVCTLCQVTMGNRLYSLKRHLFRHHPQVFRVNSPVMNRKMESPPMKNQSMKNDPEIATWRGSEGDHQVVQLKDSSGGSLKRCKMSDGADNAPQDSKHNEAFVGWLRSDVIPMKSLQSELFREFLALVNPKFKMPQVVIQPQQLHKLNLLDSNLGKAENSTTSRSIDLSTIAAEPRFMKGLCLQGNGLGPRLVTDLVVPTPAPHEALIEVLRAGICGTDLQMIDNYKPGFKGALGHEFVGIVRKLGAQFTNDEQTQRVWIGQRVVGEINLPCDASNCATCARCSLKRTHSGDTLTREEVMRRNHCPNRSCLGIVRKDGAFAEYITLPLANLYAVPDGIMDSHAVFAEPLAAACRILEQQVVQPSDNVVVLGDGKLGLMVAEVLHAKGAAKTITLVGKHREKLALAKHFVNTVYTLNSADEVEMATLAERMEKEMAPFDVCVESTGTPNGIALALRLVRERGTVVMKSTCSTKRSTVDVRAVQSKRLRVVGSRCGPIPWALRLLQDRKIDVQKYIQGVYPLERAEAALAHAAQRGTLKIQLVIR